MSFQICMMLFFNETKEELLKKLHATLHLQSSFQRHTKISVSKYSSTLKHKPLVYGFSRQLGYVMMSRRSLTASHIFQCISVVRNGCSSSNWEPWGQNYALPYINLPDPSTCSNNKSKSVQQLINQILNTSVHIQQGREDSCEHVKLLII